MRCGRDISSFFVRKDQIVILPLLAVIQPVQFHILNMNLLSFKISNLPR